MPVHRSTILQRPLRLAAAGVVLAALAGCSTLGGNHAAMQAPINGESGCLAPPPNLRAAYNRPYDVRGHAYRPLASADGYDVTGTASWYGWESGSTTAMGTAFSPRQFTAASRDLPLPTCVQVMNLSNGRSALVLVNDRGPFVDGRIIDLSYATAHALGIASTAQVRIVALHGGAAASAPSAAQPPVATPTAPASAAVAVVAVLAQDQGSTSQPLPALNPVAPSRGAASALARHYLQTGAFSSLVRARAEQRRLNRAGIAGVELVPGLVNGRTWYRVEVGPLAAAEPDPRLRQQLQQLGLRRYSLVQQ